MPDANGAKVRMKIRHPLVELTLMRLKEFGREPDVAFWVFAFPLLLTIAAYTSTLISPTSALLQTALCTLIALFSGRKPNRIARKNAEALRG